MNEKLTQESAIHLVKECRNRAKVAVTKDLERFSRYYKLVRNKQVDKNYTGLANLFIPEPYRIVRKKAAKLANAIRSIKVRPEGPQDVQSAIASSQFLNWLRRKLNWFMLEKMAIQESRIVGLCWIKCLWNVGKEEQDKPWKGFDLSVATVDQILLSPNTTIMDVFDGNIDYLIHEYESDYNALELNPNYDETALSILKTRTGGNRKEGNVLQQSRVMFTMSQNDKKSDKFKITEYWGRHDGKDYFIVLADDNVVLRFGENPFVDLLEHPIPFVPIVANGFIQEMFPVGDIEPAESLFNELNDTRNQRMDTVTLNVDPMKIIVRGANIDKKQLIAKRGWIVESNIPGGVQVVPPDMQGVAASINEEKNIRGDISQVTGTLDFAAGSDVQAGLEIDTARGTIIAKGESDSSLEDEMNTLKVCLTMLYRIVLSYAKIFLDREFMMRITEKGEESFIPMSREAIQGNYDLDIEMRTLQDKTTEQQLQLLLFNQAKTIPGANVGRFFTDVLNSFKEDINISEYYQEPQPQGPPPPSISVSLRGDLNLAEVDEIYKTMPGVDPKAADPLFRKEFRDQMRGNDPAEMDKEKHEAEVLKLQSETIKNIRDDKRDDKKE